MIRAGLETEVAAILRRVAFSGSDREIKSGDPLGEFGLGLDSLALLESITALENRFEIEIPETIWVDQGRLTFNDLVGLIAKSLGDRELPTLAPAHNAVATGPMARPESAWGKLTATAQHRGVLPALSWAATKIVAKFVRLLYQKVRFYILAFDLSAQPIPTLPAPSGTTFGEVSPNDLPATGGLWQKVVAKEKQRLFIDRLSKGYTGYATWLNGKIVGLCWVTDDGDYEPDTGLQVKLRERSCYGFDLNEHPDFQGMGIGLATVSYSLRKSQERGRRFHYSLVNAENERMLAASIQILGYRKVAEIVTTRRLCRPRSVCLMPDHIVSNGILTL